MTTLRTFMYPSALVAAALLLVAGTAFAHDDSTRHTASSGMGDTITIGGAGSALIRGAEVISVGSGSITAKTEWDDATMTWTIDTNDDTSYVSAEGKGTSRDDIEVGDTVSFSGSLEGSLAVDADVVRTWEPKDEEATHLSGTVVSVASGSFVIDAGNRNVTIDVDSSTDITLRGDDDAALSDLTVGQKVKVEGSYDGDEFDASSVVGFALSANDGTKGHGWKGVLDFFHGFKFGWNK